MRRLSGMLAALILLAPPPVASAPALYAVGPVAHAVRLPDGSIIVAGQFTTVGEAPRAHIAKLSPEGQLDPSWTAPDLAPGFAAQAVALAANADGTVVYIATQYQAVAVEASGSGNRVAGFAATVSGSVDGFNSGIRTLGVDPSGSVYLAGAFAYVNGQPRNALARLTNAGAIDAGWVPSTNSVVNALDIDALGGFVYIGGAFVTVNGAAHLRIARLQLADGSVDASWTPSVSSTQDGVRLLALAPAGGAIVLAGNFSAVNATPRNGVARIATANAALDGWNPPAAGYAINALLADDDYVYLGGEDGCCGTNRLVRISAAAPATMDSGWSPQPDATVKALLPDGADALLAFGDFSHVGDVPVLGAAAISSTAMAGHALPDFAVEGAAVTSAAEDGGGVLIAGNFRKVDNVYREGLFRLLPDATIDSAFVPPRIQGGSGQWLALAVDTASGVAYAGGSFATAGGAAHDSLVRLDAATGVVDPSWTTGVSGSIQAIAVDGDAIYVGGSFTQVGNTPRANLARLSSAGTLAAGVATTNGAVSRIVVDGDSVFVGGQFLSPRKHVARLSRADGSFDPAWNPVFDWTLTWNGLFDLISIDETAYVSTQAAIPFGGGYVSVGELVAIDRGGAAAPLARFNQPVYNLLAARDGGSLYAAGSFQTLYALDDFFAQISRPAGLAQISLRHGTLGVAEAWSPAVLPAGGAPGLARLGVGAGGVLAGVAVQTGFPRPGLELLALPLGDFLFADEFD